VVDGTVLTSTRSRSGFVLGVCNSVRRLPASQPNACQTVPDSYYIRTCLHNVSCLFKFKNMSLHLNRPHCCTCSFLLYAKQYVDVVIICIKFRNLMIVGAILSLGQCLAV